MKLNWGTGIAIFYSSFVVIMILMVIKSSQNKPELVQENYYQLDLDYEQFRQKRQNAANMDGEVKVNFNNSTNTLKVNLPAQMETATGQVKLFRPSNKALDESFPISLDENGEMNIHFDTPRVNGHWTVIVDWEANGVSYYKEESIVF